MTTKYTVSGRDAGDCRIDSAVNRVSNSINEVAQKAGKVADGTIRTAIIARDGMDKANKAIVGLRKIACVMSDLGAIIEQLSLHSATLHDIPDAFEQFSREVVQVTSKHLDQSAGEPPDPVRIEQMKEDLDQIVEHTTLHVNEVAQQVSRLSREIETCVHAIDGGIKQVEEGHKAAYNSFAVLDQVLDTLEDNSIKIDQILTAAEDISVSGSEMIDIVNRVVEEISSSAQYITHISGKLKGGPVHGSSEKGSSDNGRDMQLYPFIREDFLLA